MNILKKIALKTGSIIKVFGSKIIRLIELANLKAEWKINNFNNDTFPVNYFPINLVDVGDYSYGPINVYYYFAEGEGLVIGKYCSIAKDVKFILGGNHRTDCLMTFPVNNKFGQDHINESLTKGKIILEDDVWIGVGATILSGVTIGKGTVVAAAAVVTKSFPPYSIVGGNPAKILKMRFEEDVLKNININYENINPEIINDYNNLFNAKLDSTVLAKISNVVENNI